MTRWMPSIARVVRCPKCRKVLAELVDVPVYKCGGCGTVLQAGDWNSGFPVIAWTLTAYIDFRSETLKIQDSVPPASFIAKNRKSSVRNTTSGSEETDHVNVNVLEHASEDEKSSISIQKAITLPTEEDSLDQDNGSNQNESVDCNWEQPAVVNFSNEVSSSTELTHHENDESSPVAGANSKVDENNETGSNFKSSITDSDLTHHENDESSPVAGANSEVDENNETGSNFKSSTTVSDLTHHENDESSPVEGENSEVDENHENDESSPVAGANSEVDENNETGPNFKSSTADNLPATWGTSSIITDECLVNENISSDAPLSQYNDQLEKSQRSVLHVSDHVRSPDILETTELINPSSELSGTLRDLSKSPTTRSSHAYDGSVSSYDGTDDQVPDQHLHLYKRTYTAADFVGNEERPQRENFPVNMMRRSNSEMQHQARNSLSISSNKKHHSMWDSDAPLEPTRYGHPVRNRMRLERDEFPSRVPFYSRGSQAGYENGGPSSHVHDQFQCSLGFHSTEKPEHPEEEKIKLLRMVFELQDQLNRTRVASGRVPTGVAWKEKQIRTYSNRKAPEDENFHNLNHPNHPRRCRQETNWSQQCIFSRMPHSGEATSSRLQANHVCANCCPQDWQDSVQLPPPVHCCNEGLCRVHPGHNCYNPHSSSPSSPLRYMDSEFPLWNRDTKSDDQRHKERRMDLEISSWGRDTKSDDQRHKDHAMKKYYFRERHMVKQHFRPIAGGAPFITCYRCSKLLQLPADFLLFKRRCHRLRCGSCSEVLKFSLQNSVHIVPYTPGAINPPPSEVDDRGDFMNRGNLASASRTNDCQHADPVSCSDDYGLSCCKSCSTEGDHVSITAPLHVLQGNTDNGKMTSSSSFEPMTERKKRIALKPSLNKYKNPVETYESAGPSSNMSNVEKFSSEIEEVSPTRGSPLHRLMGYSSASDLIYDGSSLATSSYYPVKNSRSRS